MSENPDGIANGPIEPTIPSTGTTFYCCFSKDRKILYQYNKNGPDIESLAARCLEEVPPHHKWYFHTVGTRTFGYLMSDNCTYFAIVEPTIGSTMLHDFLNRIREVFISVPKKNLERTLAPVIAQFVHSLEQMQGNGGSVVNGDESFHEQEGLVSDQTKRKKREKKDKKSKKNEIQMEEIAIVGEGEGRDRAVRMDVLGNGEERGIDGSERNRMGRQLSSKRVWWSHVKIVAAVDVAVCLVLLGIWLAVCQGFKCVR